MSMVGVKAFADDTEAKIDGINYHFYESDYHAEVIGGDEYIENLIIP